MQPAKMVRVCPALEAHGSSALKETDSVKAGRGRKAKADKVPQPAELKVEADAAKLDPISVTTDLNLCSGAVKPHTPAKVQPKAAPVPSEHAVTVYIVTLELASLRSTGPK